MRFVKKVIVIFKFLYLYFFNENFKVELIFWICAYYGNYIDNQKIKWFNINYLNKNLIKSNKKYDIIFTSLMSQNCTVDEISIDIKFYKFQFLRCFKYNFLNLKQF